MTTRRRLLAGMVSLLALTGSILLSPPASAPVAAAGQKVWVYYDQNEEEDFYVQPSGRAGRLIKPWDPNGQMCIFPGGSGRFVTGYNPTNDESNAGSKKPLKNPPVGEAVWNVHGAFTGK